MRGYGVMERGLGLLQGIEDDFLRVDEEAFAGAMGQEARDLVTSCYLRLRAGHWPICPVGYILHLQYTIYIDSIYIYVHIYR